MTTPGIDRIRVAANAVVIRADEVLLIEFDDASGVHYNFPGGGVEIGETLEQAVRREVMEEANLEIAVNRLLLVVESVGARNTNIIRGERVPWNEVRFFFLGTPAENSDARLPNTPDANQVNVRWVRISDLESIRLLPQISHELITVLNMPSAPTPIVANPHP